MSNSSQLTERIQQNEALISAPPISANADHMKSLSDLFNEDSVIEEDKTYAKSLLGTTEETSGAEQRVLSVRWNFVSYQFVLDLREIATLNLPREMLKVSQQSSIIQWDSCHPSLQSSRCSFKNFVGQSRTGCDELLEGELKKEWLIEAGHWIAICKLIHSFKDVTSSKAFAAVTYLYMTQPPREVTSNS